MSFVYDYFLYYVKINLDYSNERWEVMYPQPLIYYLVYFHSLRDYFECHEVLEEYWKEDGKNNEIWVGFIQLAVAMYHHRRKNYLGAEKQLRNAIGIFDQEKLQLDTLGFDTEEFSRVLKEKSIEIKQRLPYSSINLPIANHDVIQACTKTANNLGACWGEEILIISKEIIDKHKLRDRSAVIAERDKQLLKRRDNNF
jgi:uncharacterized protein